MSNVQAQSKWADRWSIAVTHEYINWRYLEHPASAYRLQLIQIDGIPAGFVVSKKVRIGISLLMDQFMVDQHVSAGLGQLPWFTVSFKTEASTRELSKSLWPLPFKKRIPFFFTHYQLSFSDRDLMNLGLSASDF